MRAIVYDPSSPQGLRLDAVPEPRPHDHQALIEVRLEGAGWEVQVVSRRDSWWRRWLRAWREERQARLLAQLDERILRDIGLDAGSGDPLAARADAYRQQEARRIAMARLGLM